MSKSGQAFPPFAPIVLQYLGFALHHPHQISLAQFCAYHLRDVIYNLDMIAIARTTKLTDTKRANVEDESIEISNDQAVGVETEFYGGEQGPQSEDEDVTGSESWRARYVLDRAELVGILSRQDEVAAASKKGKKHAEVMQMKMFDDVFQEALNARVQPEQMQPSDVPLSY